MNTITYIVPCYNEEANVENTINEILIAININTIIGEIIIIDDGSTDDTYLLANKLAIKHDIVRVIRNSRNMGLGYSYFKGVKASNSDFVSLIPGDDCLPYTSISYSLSQIGTADCILIYTNNLNVRNLGRRILSRLYALITIYIYRLNLNNINGTTIIRRSILNNLDVRSQGFSYSAEILVKLIRSGYTYTEVGAPIRERKYGKPSALKIKNIISVVINHINLFIDVLLINRSKYNKLRNRIN